MRDVGEERVLRYPFVFGLPPRREPGPIDHDPPALLPADGTVRTFIVFVSQTPERRVLSPPCAERAERGWSVTR